MSQSSEPLAAAHRPTEPTDRQRTLQWSLFAGFTTMFTAYSGLGTVLLPAQVADLTPGHKEASLALVSTVSSIVTIFIPPIVGALSDRTRTRFGRRSPWMALGAVTSMLGLLAIGHATSILALMVLWVAVQVLLNVIQAPLTAILADRVAPQRRGMFSALIGIGSQIGGTLGVVIAARFAEHYSIGYSILAALVLVVSLAFVLLNADSSTPTAPQPFSLRAFLSGFWVSPRAYPDYAWAFAARLLLILGYWGIFTYQRYTLTDYVKLHGSAVDRAQTIMSVLALIGTLISSVPAARLSDRLGRRKIFVAASSVGMAASLCIPMISPTLAAMYAYALLSGISFGVYLTLDLALMTEVLPHSTDAGKDLGLLNVATNLPQALGPIIGASLVTGFSSGADKVLGYRVLFGFAIVMVLFGALAVKPIRSVR